MTDSERTRAFIAVELNDSVRIRLSEVVERLRSSSARVSWVKPGNLHLTLRFLGDLDRDTIERIGEGVDRNLADTDSFAVLAHGLGAFPNLRRPKTIWCGIEGDVATLAEMQSRVETACRSAGLGPDEKPFHPHITLGRVRERTPLRDLVQILHNFRDARGGEVEVAAVTLFSSTLDSSGSMYTKLREFSLK